MMEGIAKKKTFMAALRPGMEKLHQLEKDDNGLLMRAE